MVHLVLEARLVQVGEVGQVALLDLVALLAQVGQVALLVQVGQVALVAYLVLVVHLELVAKTETLAVRLLNMPFQLRQVDSQLMENYFSTTLLTVM